MVGVEFLVGGWFASPVIGRVVEKVKEYLGANWELQKGTQEMVEDLTGTLLECQATVQVVEKRAIINNPALANLLRRLKLAACEAEDVLDDMEVQRKNKVHKLVSSSLSVVRNTFFPDDNLKSLKKVVDQLNKLSAGIPNILNLVNLNENYELHNREVTDPRETISQPLDEVGLFGREDELNLILDLILDLKSESSKNAGQNNKNYRGIFVIPIVGMGGVGKTTVAQSVYNNPEVQQTFPSRAWISVCNKPDIVYVMPKIIQYFERYPPKTNSRDLITLEDLSSNLRSIIRGVKFLIVLDDMPESQWDVIYRSLSNGAAGSVVLITTQNQVFANEVGTFGSVALSALDPGKFWELFKHFAFGNHSNYWVITPEKQLILESIGKKIADKLHGLPLAAKIIGKILRSNMDEGRWRRISESEWWDIPEGKNQILPTIGVGYQQLDPCLRQCFAYCSIFPKNSLIKKDRLVHMWIAQNFIQPDVNGVMNLEDIGRQWFDELVEKSFFQHAWDNNGYVMHELMHDLAVIVSSGECFYLGEGSVEIPSGVRHLAVDTNNLEVIRGIQKHKNLRSFLYFGCCKVKGMYRAVNDTLSTLDRIRVLDLSYMCGENYSKPPPAIWNLKHLRFLDLSSTGFQVLTHYSVDQYLYHLQALYIQKCKFLELPRGINKLRNLRHLCTDEETIKQISAIGQLTNLQELGVFVVSIKEGYRITELRNLRELRGTLRINNFEYIKNKDEAMRANLIDKKHLDSVCVYSSSTPRNPNEDMEVLQGLQPHKDIKQIKISSYFGSDFPNWIIQIGYFLNLNSLCLVSCVNVKVLPPLGELPSLKFLHMEDLCSVNLINYHLYGTKHTVFPLLQELILGTLSICEKWTDARAREFFPCLSKLNIKNTKTLREAPLDSFCSSLKELIIDGCDNLISLENSIPRLSSLTHLELCNSSVSVSFDPLNMPLLEALHLLNCLELKIEGDVQFLTHLKHLRLYSCPKLFSTYFMKDQQKGKCLQVHHGEGLRSLTHIEADNSLFYHEYHLILGSLPSLRVLKFNNSTIATTEFWFTGKRQCFMCEELPKSPMSNIRVIRGFTSSSFYRKNLEHTRFTNHQILWFQELTTLQEIHFSRCEFEHLPDSLTLLSSLKKVVLDTCCKLKSLTDSMPPNLQELTIRYCSEHLAGLCKGYEDEDRPFVSNNLVIHIDDTIYSETLPHNYEMLSMKIQKPQISNVIGRRACRLCGKTIEQTDFVLINTGLY